MRRLARAHAGMVGVCCGLGLLLCAPARASHTSIWLEGDLWQPLAPEGSWLPNRWRAEVEVRFFTFHGAPSLLSLNTRTGPAWQLGPLFLGLHAYVATDRQSDGTLREELRGELEPALTLRLGDLDVNDRNRLEYRWFPDETRWRYRNRLRLRLSPADWWARPFLSEEVFLDLSGRGFNQNRAQLGLVFQLSDSAQLEVAYLHLAVKRQEAWRFSHVVALTYVFAPPPPGG